MEKLIIKGQIPEKQFTLLRLKDGTINQNQNSINWEKQIKEQFSDFDGWTSYSDPSRGAYTPLQVKLLIHTHERPTLIKQIKATLDAYSDIAYINDCSIVDLTAERISDTEEYAELQIRPAKKENIKIPDGKYIPLERYIGPVKNSTFDVAGYPLQAEEYKKDKELRNYIREQFAAEKKIEGDFEMTLHFSTLDVGAEIELEEKLKQLNMEKFPVRRPDLDNCAYSVLAALQGILFDEPEALQKIHIFKTYYNPEIERNRVWIGELS